MRQTVASPSGRFNKIVAVVKDNKVKILVTVVVLILIANFFANRNKSEADIQRVGAPVDIQRTFSIPAQNDQEQTVNKNLTVKVTDVQRQKRVLVKGSWVKAREGKVFLTMNLDVTNDVRATLYGSPVDWVRLASADDKKLAPTVHQGLIEVRPQSTKETNVGFVVDENATSFKVEIGRVWGLEDTIDVQF